MAEELENSYNWAPNKSHKELISQMDYKLICHTHRPIKEAVRDHPK